MEGTGCTSAGIIITDKGFSDCDKDVGHMSFILAVSDGDET